VYLKERVHEADGTGAPKTSGPFWAGEEVILNRRPGAARDGWDHHGPGRGLVMRLNVHIAPLI